MDLWTSPSQGEHLCLTDTQAQDGVNFWEIDYILDLFCFHLWVVEGGTNMVENCCISSLQENTLQFLGHVFQAGAHHVFVCLLVFVLFLFYGSGLGR